MKHAVYVNYEIRECSDDTDMLCCRESPRKNQSLWARAMHQRNRSVPKEIKIYGLSEGAGPILDT